MIFDAQGNLWVTPRTIGFRCEVQTTSHEPADSVTFSMPGRNVPEFVSEESSAEPYASRRVP